MPLVKQSSKPFVALAIYLMHSSYPFHLKILIFCRRFLKHRNCKNQITKKSVYSGIYWKIFLSFWLATILIIVTTAWVTSEIAQKSSIPEREREFMDSYANAAVVTFEAGHHNALKKWLEKSGLSKHVHLFLLTDRGDIVGDQNVPTQVKQISLNFVEDKLDEGIFKSGHLIVSHEILSTSGVAYRLAAISEKPLPTFVRIPWAGLTARLLIAIFISGLICYLLSIYLTKPLRSLRLAAISLATGKLNTRVGRFAGHYKDEIAELSYEFDSMAEQLEALLKSKQRLLQDISHELRSPLARLQIAIELGRKKTSHLATAEFERMESECLRLNALIGEALDFARVDQSPDSLNTSLVDLPTLLSGVINDANYEYSKTIPRIIVGKIDPCQLMLDEKLIHRAIENILRNALRYTPQSQVVVISLHIDALKKSVFIDIDDSGPGVPEDQLTKIFNPFYRVDTSREKKTGGYGLGLTIAKQAIELHRGKVIATNREQGGLLVRITLPLD